MIQTETCPQCRSKNLRTLKKQQFVRPEISMRDILTGPVEYNRERLWIFFDKIWKDSSTADFDVCLCSSCGLIFTNPRFSEKEIAIKYLTVGEIESDKQQTQIRTILKKDERASRIYNLLAGLYRGNHRTRKVLDYGGGRGYNLTPFLQKTDDCYLLDFVEYDTSADITYLGKNIDALQKEDAFDVILLCHILEHAIDPAGIIRNLLSHLTDTGMIYIEVPLGCWGEWKYLHEPLTHINFFSEESLYKCLRACGLHVIHLSTAYQWVARSKLWCVNIVGCKDPENTITNFKTTQKQMYSRYYSLPLIREHPGRYVKKILKLLWK